MNRTSSYCTGQELKEFLVSMAINMK